jgi:Xaa-Pro dipeptidase
VCTDRRDFLKVSAGVVGASLLAPKFSFGATDDVDLVQQRQDVPDLIKRLPRMTKDVVPITDDERKARMAKAQRLMGEQKIDALYIEPGSSMFYFTGMRWGTSERMFALVIPQRGELAWVCPKFEEERARELIKFGNDIRTWEEDESPYRRVVEIIKDRGTRFGRVGIEERVRFFLYDGIRLEAPKLEFVSATQITAGCRMFKSPAEIALLQKSNDLLLMAYRAPWATMRDGMPQGEFAGNCAAALNNLGVQGGIFCSFGKYTAFPHGSSTPQTLEEGDVVLMDGGCSVEG